MSFSIALRHGLFVGLCACSNGTNPSDASFDSSATDGGGLVDVTTDSSKPTDPMAIVLPLSTSGHDRLFGVTYDSKGSIFAVGQITTTTDAMADVATVVAKITPAGELDKTFGGTGFVTRNISVGTNGEIFRAIVVQSTGKIVVAGTIEHAGASDPRDRDIALARFNPDGTKDASFGNDGIVVLDLSTGVVVGNAYSADSGWGLAVYPDDRLVVSGGKVRTNGTDTDFAIIRTSADGVPDATFGTNGVFSLDTIVNNTSSSGSPRNLTILPNNEGIVGSGYQPYPSGDTSPVVFKVTDKGVLDTTFATNGVFTTQLLKDQTEAYAVAVQPGNPYKLVTTGYGKELSSETTDLVSLRFTAQGALDTTYGTNGVVRIDIGGFGDNSRKLATLPDGRIMLVGGGRLTSADVDGLVAILAPDGKPDTTFAPKGWKTYNLGGPADFLWACALSPDNSAVAIVGLKGVGTMPMPPTANDDSALLILPIK